MAVALCLACCGRVYAEAWSFAVMGDTQGNTANPGTNIVGTNYKLNDVLANRDVSFVMIPGDLITGYNGIGNEAEWANFKANMAAEGLKEPGTAGSNIPYYVVRGNHDTTDDAGWLAAFSYLPQNGPAMASGGGGNSEVGYTYSFTQNNALIIGFDNYRNGPYKDNNDWLAAQLTGVTGPVFAFGHGPAYQMIHPDCLAQNQADRITTLTDLFNAGGRFYFSGHDHVDSVGRVYEKDPATGGTQGFYVVNVSGGNANATVNFDGVYNSNYPSDFPVADLYHDNDPSAGIANHYGYAIVTVDGQTVWLKIYGSELATPTDFHLLYSLVSGGVQKLDAGTLTGNLGNDSGVEFHQDTNATYTGSIDGAGGLTKSGAGRLNLNGTNTYTGPTAVDDGVLSVNGNSGSTDVAVGADGILQGIGTIKSLTNNGAVKPGNSIGTLNLNGGAYVQGAGGSLEIEAASTSSYDRIIGASNATLGGRLKVINEGAFAAGDALSGVLQTAAGISGMFDALDNQITPTLVWNPVINGTNLDLVATRDYNNQFLRADLNANQARVAAAIQGFLPAVTSGDLLAVRSSLDALSSNAQVAAAYTEISPVKLSAMMAAAMLSTQDRMKTLDSQLQEFRQGLDTPAAPDDAQRSMIVNGALDAAEQGSGFDAMVSPRTTSGPYGSDQGVFIKMRTALARQEAGNDLPGFGDQTTGIVGGSYFKPDNDTIVGIDAGFAQTTADFNGNGGDLQVNTLSLGGFGTHRFGDLYVNGALDLETDVYDTTRNIAFGDLARKAQGNTRGGGFNSMVGGGYDLYAQDLVTGPVWNVTYSKLWIAGFTETGADALNLRLEGRMADSLQPGIGWQARYTGKLWGMDISPQARLMYRRELLSDSRTFDAAFAGSKASFSSTEYSPAKYVLEPSAAITVKFNQKLSSSLAYQRYLGQGQYDLQSVNGLIKYAF